ncbi:helix-turn-helix domain-containing protein [Microbacterium esteraromaticum]|uniref:Helix-turn-helix domain-containing protein n=1 Tax=Microbacterium esteraromaticum TaxID=57043 RepID=A0A7D8AL53_9MICO|nr:helix-turn-helix domain-containing protein [Microbacterium esteraromaticum]QMU98209.1 helix-turn-helix domain-containing protein [Microbacterium esteraromaticum]
MPATVKPAVTLTAADFDLPNPLPVAFDVRDAAPILGVGESTMWLAVRSGEIPSIRIRGRVLIPTVPFLRMFGIEHTND